jgi:hypothetical protein
VPDTAVEIALSLDLVVERAMQSWDFMNHVMTPPHMCALTMERDLWLLTLDSLKLASHDSCGRRVVGL